MDQQACDRHRSGSRPARSATGGPRTLRTLSTRFRRFPTWCRRAARDRHEEAANRRRVEQLRDDPAYSDPFDHPDPLVTVCIPTYDRVELLTERALPSVLAQTHRRLEVLVVGDGSPPHVAEAVAAIGDDRIRFVNLTHRHATTDADRHWLVGSVSARNAGYAHAGGHWIVDFDDDDEMRPQAVERVLAMAREQRLEVVYGKLAAHFADGRTETIGRFPPTVHQFGWQEPRCSRTALRRPCVGRRGVRPPNDWFPSRR